MKKGNIALMAAVLGMLGTAGTAYAETPVYTLKGITVTATRQAESLQDVPANVQVVTEQQIKERNIQNAAQAVALATGVSVDTSIEPSVAIRGYDSKNILVLLDGQPMNNAWDGEVDWGMIPVDNISKIEVVSGGQSALYGGRAVGGVINIMTKTQKQDGVSGSVNVGYGSNNTWKQNYMVNGKNEKWTYGAFYESHVTDGWRTYKATATAKDLTSGGFTPSDYETDTSGEKYVIGDRGEQSFLSETYGFNLGYNFSDDKKLTYKYSHNNYHWDYVDPATYLKDTNGNPIWQGTNKPTDKTFLGTKGWRAYDMHSLTYNDQDNKVHAHLGLTDYTTDGYTSAGTSVTEANDWNGKGTKSEYPSKSWNFDLNKRWTFGDHTVLAGTSYGQEKFDETIYGSIDNWKDWQSQGTVKQYLGGKSRMWSLYAQDKWAFSDKWTAYIGGRYDHYTKYGGYSQEVGQAETDFASADYGKFSPKLSLDYAWNDDTNFYVSFGKSFNPPLLYQVYRYSESRGNIYNPNPGLEPETTTNWEFGMKKKFSEATSLNASIFYAKTKDYIQLITTGRIATGGDVKEYQNTGDAKTHGVELALNHKWNDTWASYVNYTWQSGDVSGNNGSQNSPDLPKHLLHTGVTYTNDPWTVMLDGTFVSERNDEHGGKIYTGRFGSYDPYFLLNLAANYQATKDTSVQFGIYNLLNREYYDDEVTAGRTYNVSVRYTF